MMQDHTELFELVRAWRANGMDAETMIRRIRACHNGRLEWPINQDNLHLFRRYRNTVSASPEALVTQSLQHGAAA